MYYVKYTTINKCDSKECLFESLYKLESHSFSLEVYIRKVARKV